MHIFQYILFLRVFLAQSVSDLAKHFLSFQSDGPDMRIVTQKAHVSNDIN